VLNDWRTAPIQEKLRVMLGFLEKLTLDPQSLTPADVRPLREAGLSDAAIEDAMHVCAQFNIYDRLADSFCFDVPGPDAFAQGAVRLLRRGYA
jgi:alkylhydroperoxidase family enzyme